MRRFLLLGLAALAAAPSARAGDVSASTPAYRALGEIAVQHAGRVKPLDTFAAQMVKQVYTREVIKLTSEDGKTVTKWDALPAWLDWQARPQFWDAQEIVAVPYPPLKQKLISNPAREALATLAASGKLSAEDKARVEEASKNPEVSQADLKAAAALKGVPEGIKARLLVLAHKIHPDNKWLSPDDLEAGVLDVDGRQVAYKDWCMDLARRARAEADGEKSSLTPLETKALEAAQKLNIYMTVRDGNRYADPTLDLFVTPRPLGADALKYTAEAAKVAFAEQQHDHEAAGEGHEHAEPTPMQTNALNAWLRYAEDLKATNRKMPGVDPEFDAKFSEWIREKSAWVPLRLVLDSELDDLKRAGFDAAKVEVFRQAWKAVLQAEKAQPGALPEAAANALRVAARELGESTAVPYLLAKDVDHATWGDLDKARVKSFAAARDRVKAASTRGNAPSEEGVDELLASARSVAASLVTYPPPSEMAREVSFNRFAPFYKAPMAYGLALVLLVLSLGAGTRSDGRRGVIDLGLYVAGMLAFVAGIGLEILGFYYRVRISGWAPVTNMYETVIWVALVTSVIGLILELIYRKTYAAAAASGVALLATVLAANVSLLDPDIKSLAPVLRDNYWLTIHVLTIVSSYAAFALAMGLGLLAIGYYLTATYRRDVSYARLALPFLPSLPMLAIGVGGLIAASTRGGGGGWSGLTLGFLAMAGLVGTIVGLFGLIGELCSRSSKAAIALGAAMLALGVVGTLFSGSVVTPAWWPDTVSLLAVPAIVGGLGVAVMILGRLGAIARGVMSAAGSKPPAEEFTEIDAARAEASSLRASNGGGVATLARPSVAQIRAREEASRPPIDGRSLSMQATAARIKPLSNFIYRAMQVGVLLVAAGTILGGVWADVSWGRFWGWDAKEVWALVTLLVYLVPLHGRFAGWVNTFGLTAASVACFASVLMAWYGVNFVLATGLHSYGFVEGGGQGVVLTASVAVLAVVGATWRRRRLASSA